MKYLYNRCNIVKIAIIIVCMLYTKLFLIAASPVQPDFSNFESVSTNNMVNEFDGSFTYNLPILTVPGPNGSSYSIGLSYHSGLSPEADASWVGYGWTLNPGSIVRNTKGYPDDYYDNTIEIWNKVEPNTTLSLSSYVNPEVFSFDFAEIGLNVVYSYNNYIGYSIKYGLSASIFNAADIDIGYNNTGTVTGAFTHLFHPSRALTDFINYADYFIAERINETKNDQNQHHNNSDIYNTLKYTTSIIDALNNAIKFNNFGYYNNYNYPPLYNHEFSGESLSGTISLEKMVLPNIGADAGITFSYSKQSSKNTNIKNAVGFLYSGDINKSLMDYSVEKETPYYDEKMFLGIPFGNTDYYNVTGEGVTGTFRAYNNKIGHFYPNPIECNTKFLNIKGISLDIGFGIGIGLNLSGASHSYKLSPWNDVDISATNYNSSTKQGEPIFFKFLNDYGSKVDFSNPNDIDEGHKVTRVKLSSNPHLPSSAYIPILNDKNERIKRSSFISYNTLEDFNNEKNMHDWKCQFFLNPVCWPHSEFGNKFPRIIPYNKDHTMYNNYHYKDNEYENLKKQIMEFSITNNQGYNYTYGLPVFSREESELSYGVYYQNSENYNLTKSRIYFKTSPQESKKTVGQIRTDAYASMYLLTSISTPDYVDVKQDGFTHDDLGGYTLFGYEKTAGKDWKNSINDKYIRYKNGIDFELQNLNNDKSGDFLSWYRWRTPYKGYYYNRNSLSDRRDEMAIFSRGERENYYLETIETKTHIAFFINNKSEIQIKFGGDNLVLEGSGEIRRDAHEACLSEYENGSDMQNQNCNIDTDKMRRLERIELYAKADDYESTGNLTKKLQTTYFEYDYSLMEYNASSSDDYQVPNSLPDGMGGNYNGKLTLRKVWTEYEDVSEDTYSPYQFSYEYKERDYPNVGNFDTYREHHKISGGGEIEQNPAYNPDNIDRWGFYQDDDGDGTSRAANMNNWVDQTPGETFDPAAWHLKEIKLPTGGEIHVYYEQNEYSYVQDRPAMAMAAIKNYSANLDDKTMVRIDCGDLGDFSTAQLDEWVSLLKNYYITNKNKLYFKFLFDFLGDSPGIDNCSSEYIDGFVNVKSIERNQDDIVFLFEKNIMRDLCSDFFRVYRSGHRETMKLNCNKELFNINNVDKIATHIKDFLWTLSDMFTIFNKNTFYCNHVNVSDLSYIRIPLLNAKKGGGVRVKSIIMYDEFNEKIEDVNDLNFAYGHEYIYELEDGRSSGVASNEPPRGYEENPLFNYLKTEKDKKFWDIYKSGVFVIGPDMKKEFAMPIGESLLPTAHVGYSRVLIKNIFEGITDNGYTVKQYYTTKDYPFDKSYILPESGKIVKGVEYTGIDKKDPGFQISIANFRVLYNNVKVSQGYQFIVNSMNGQLRSEYKMGGQIDNEPYVSSFTEYEYYEPCEKIPVSYGIGDIKMEYFGRQVEFFQDGRKIEESSISPEGELDIVYIPFLIPIIIPSIFPSLDIVENKLSTHVTNKVIRYPAILKSTKSMQNGIVVKTENIAFDHNTGQPAITRITDEFDGFDLFDPGPAPFLLDHDGSYYSYKFVAANEYKSLGHKSDNEKNMIVSTPDIKINKIFDNEVHFLEFNSTNSNECIEIKDFFAEGDLIRPQKKSSYSLIGYFHISSIQDNRVILEPLYDILTSKVSLYKDIDIEVIRSGKTNQLGNIAGNIVTYGQRDKNSINKLLPKNPTSIAFSSNSIPFLQIQEREDFLNDLNASVNTSLTSSPQIFSYPNLNDLIYFKNDEGNCELLDDEIQFNIQTTPYLTNYYDIKVCIERTENILTEEDYDYDYHALVVDLNNLLDDVWSKNLYFDIKNYKYWFECNCDYYVTETQNYNYWGVHANKEERDIVVKTFNSLGLTDILQKEYVIMDSLVLGSNILSFDYIDCIPIMDELNFNYIIDKEELNVLTGRMDLIFNYGINDTLQIVRQTQPYPIECMNDTTITNIEECVKLDCRTFQYMGCGDFQQEWPWWRAFIYLPFMDDSKILISPISDSVHHNNQFMYNEMELNEKFTEKFGRFICQDGWLKYEPLNNDYYSDLTAKQLIQLYDSNEVIKENICCFQFQGKYNDSDFFILDEENGYQIVLDQDKLFIPTNDCQKFCIEFCPDIYPNMKLEGVIKADAVTFSDNWDNDFDSPSGNNYLAGRKGKWRIEDSYLYNTSIKAGAGSASDKIYLNSGVFGLFHNIFNWKYKDGNYNWLFVNSVDKYDHNGNAIESSDILGIKSSQLYGFNNTLPVMVANNASSGFIGFESFEDKQTSPIIDDTKAHTGRKSLMLDENETNGTLIFEGLKFDQQVLNEGFNVKAWFHTKYDLTDPNDNTQDHLHLKVVTTGNSNQNFSRRFYYKAQTGEWSLYEVIIDPNDISSQDVGDKCDIYIINDGVPELNFVWVDDIKIYPTNAQSNCYVYDNNDFKLLASFDDQHYALLYQYNAKGDLVRKLIETERGIKTIAEAQYNTPKIPRSVEEQTPSIPIDGNIPINKNDLNIKFSQPQPKKYSLSKEDLIIQDTITQTTLEHGLIDIYLSPDAQKLEILEQDHKNLRSPDSLLHKNELNIKTPKGLPSVNPDKLNIEQPTKENLYDSFMKHGNIQVPVTDSLSKQLTKPDVNLNPENIDKEIKNKLEEEVKQTGEAEIKKKIIEQAKEKLPDKYEKSNKGGGTK